MQADEVAANQEFFPVNPAGLARASDSELWEAVNAAEIHPLLCAIALLTHDDTVLDPRFRPNVQLPPSGPPPHAGLSPTMVAEARRLAFQHLKELRKASDLGGRVPTTAIVQRAIEFTAGGQCRLPLRMIQRELDIPHDSAAPAWRLQAVSPGRRFRVAVIGSGMSGILVAHRLRQAGIEFTIFEKNPELGGTWYENSYPGCRLDTPNFAYSYSFAQNPMWPNEFSQREAIRSYFSALAERFGVTARLQLNTEVLSSRYEPSRHRWQLRVRGSDGNVSDHEFNAVVSAVGQLNKPKIPDIPGVGSFAGDAWHTAQWNHSVSLKGKRVGVIGTGASAYQVVPAILPDVASLLVFQRNPPWMLPTPRYYEPISEPHQLLLCHLPHYARWLRFYQFWATTQGRWDLVRVDPAFSHPLSVSAANEELRQALVRHIEASYADRPDLLVSQIPGYPPGAKRMLRDNGVWPAALKDPRVTLETRPIDTISPAGVRVDDGTVHDLDVIIYATGFRAAEFLAPMEVVGENGQNLHDWWNGDARAYLGMCLPGFPNFFCMYGPNTNLVVHGSLILFAESSASYITECLRLVLTNRVEALAVTGEAFQSFNELIDRENGLMAWGASQVSSWYKNDLGRVSQNWPLSLEAFFSMTETPQRDHYRFLG